MSPHERHRPAFQAILTGALALVLCSLLAYRFTSHSAEDEERARAHIVLQTIYRIQQAHVKAYGTYLPIDRENNMEILKLKDAPGRFRYRVEVSDSAFFGFAFADLDGDGEIEVWQIDREHPDPVLKNQD